MSEPPPIDTNLANDTPSAVEPMLVHRYRALGKCSSLSGQEVRFCRDHWL